MLPAIVSLPVAACGGIAYQSRTVRYGDGFTYGSIQYGAQL